MRARTAVAAALLAAALTACTPGEDESAPSTTSSPSVDPRDVCLAGLVKAYPSIDPDAPMLTQVDACTGLDDTAKSSVLETLQEYDDAHQAAIDAAASKAP
ncbi:hypothetical protein ACIQSP_19870 [Streptomyces nigra]|uniref:hypothetical protein n=1 Tax=Streptomyces nigra TaxID=1827580 RepID=UPI00381946B1